MTRLRQARARKRRIPRPDHIYIHHPDRSHASCEPQEAPPPRHTRSGYSVTGPDVAMPPRWASDSACTSSRCATGPNACGGRLPPVRRAQSSRRLGDVRAGHAAVSVGKPAPSRCGTGHEAVGEAPGTHGHDRRSTDGRQGRDRRLTAGSRTGHREGASRTASVRLLSPQVDTAWAVATSRTCTSCHPATGGSPSASLPERAAGRPPPGAGRRSVMPRQPRRRRGPRRRSRRPASPATPAP